MARRTGRHQTPHCGLGSTPFGPQKPVIDLEQAGFVNKLGTAQAPASFLPPTGRQEVGLLTFPPVVETLKKIEEEKSTGLPLHETRWNVIDNDLSVQHHRSLFNEGIINKRPESDGNIILNG